MFNAKKTKDKCVKWIREWFEYNGKDCNAVIGISGGKDSSVVAALCVEALGADRVIGVLMPNGFQKDIGDAEQLVKHLGIKYMVVNIADAFNGVALHIGYFMKPANGCIEKIDLTEQTLVNLAPRLRMATLYAVSQSCNGRVANTCNLSEEFIGYSTRWGDSVGDFSPLANLTSDEVIEIGVECGLPYSLAYKVPADGLCGKTDEDNFGFTYEVLNKYIRTGVCEDAEIKAKIDRLHEKNLFKQHPIQSFPYRTYI